MYFVYVLKSINHNKTYVGYTNNLNRRIEEHNKGRSKFTRTYKPWQLIYKEEYPTISEAMKREKYLKTSAGRNFLKKIVK